MNTFSPTIYIYSTFPFIVALFWPMSVMRVLVFTSLQIHTSHNSICGGTCERAGNRSDTRSQLNTPDMNWTTKGFQCGGCYRNGRFSPLFALQVLLLLQMVCFLPSFYLSVMFNNIPLYNWTEMNKYMKRQTVKCIVRIFCLISLP